MKKRVPLEVRQEAMKKRQDEKPKVGRPSLAWSKLGPLEVARRRLFAFLLVQKGHAFEEVARLCNQRFGTDVSEAGIARLYRNGFPLDKDAYLGD